ncbi:MAG: hypothetical protein LBU30_05390 [Candidatus Methanoplasma sp.]|jgi:hypothetical protein|nr:hypothetical protein [Candidatus Methanoplasma sp.]
MSRGLNTHGTIVTAVQDAVMFDLSVVPGDGGRVPIRVAGNVMVNVQKLISDIGRGMIAGTLSLQGDVPEGLLSRFTLYIDGSVPSVSSSADLKFESPDNMLGRALGDMLSLLEKAGNGSVGDIIACYPDPRYRLPIIRDLISLSNDLDGLPLRYSADGMKRGLFRPASVVPSLLDKGSDSCFGDIRGILRTSDGDLFLEMKDGNVPFEFEPGIRPGEDPDSLMDSPCTVGGRIRFSGTGDIERVTDVTKVDRLKELSFDRMISSDKDLALRTPLVVNIGYDSDRNHWTIGNRPLGISISKRFLDDAILEFHDQFVFMWEVYDGNSGKDGRDDDLDDDELQLHDYIVSIVKDEE